MKGRARAQTLAAADRNGRSRQRGRTCAGMVRRDRRETAAAGGAERIDFAGMRIGELLVDARLASPFDVESGLRTQAQYGGRLGSILADLGIVELDAIAAALGRQHGVPAVTSRQLGAIDPAVLAKIPRKAAERCHAIPLAMAGPRRLVVALRDPQDLAALDAIQVVAGMRIEPRVAAELQIERALERHYHVLRADDRFVRMSAQTARRRDSPPPSSARDRPRATGLSMPALPAVEVAPAIPLAPSAQAAHGPASHVRSAQPHPPGPSDIPRFAPPPRFAIPAPPTSARARSAFEDLQELPEEEPFASPAPPSAPQPRARSIPVGELLVAEERGGASAPPELGSLRALLVADDELVEPARPGRARDDRVEELDDEREAAEGPLRHVFGEAYERELEEEPEHISSLPADAILGPPTELPPVPLPRRAGPPETPLHLSLSPSAPPARGSVPPPRRVAEGPYRALSLPPEETEPRRSEPPPRASAPPPPPSALPPMSEPAPMPARVPVFDPAPAPPSTSSGPRPSVRPRSVAPRPTYDRAQAAERMAGSVTKEGVANAITAFLRGAFDCGLVLVVRDGAALGFRGFAPGVDDEAIEAIVVPLSQPSSLRAAHDGKQRVVEAPSEASTQRLLRLLGVPHAAEVAVAPVVIRGRVVNLLFGAASAKVPRAVAEALDQVAADAAAAYVRLIKSAR